MNTIPTLPALQEMILRQKLDAVMLVAGTNQTYHVGTKFHLSERPTVIGFFGDGSIRAVIPSIEKDLFTEKLPNADAVFWNDYTGYQASFDKVFGHTGALRIGVEGQRMRFFEFQALRQAMPNAVFIDCNGEIDGLRLQKSQDELMKLEKAVSIAETALQAILPKIRTGMSETQVAGLLLQAMFDSGADAPAFAPIVAAGANSSNPHAVSLSSNRIKHGDPLLLDFGVLFAGYCSDITRTVFVGSVSEKHAAFYQAVLEANQVGIKTVFPGTTCHAVDDAVQSQLENSAFSEYIMHKTGHGLGMDIHEYPYIMRGNHTQLLPGMVFTVEPGLYMSGEIGVRIEDDVTVTDTGCSVLSQFDKRLTVIPCD